MYSLIIIMFSTNTVNIKTVFLILTVFELNIMIIRLYILLVSYFLLTWLSAATLAAKLSINLEVGG